MSIIRYQFPSLFHITPSDRFSSLREDLNRLFDASLPSFSRESGWNPVLDVFQDQDNVLVQCELPGLKKEEIDLSLRDGVLTISGERKQDLANKDGEAFRCERYFGTFQRTVSLPTPVDSAQVKAVYQDGILTITLPKTEAAKPKQIEVNVS